MFAAAQKANVNVFVLSPAATRDGARRFYAENKEARWAQAVPFETGGAFIPGAGRAEDVQEDIGRIFSLTGSYYVLGYSSADLTKFHRVRVVVDRPDVVVHARTKYYWPMADEPEELAASEREKALAGVLPATDIPMRVVAAPFGADDDRAAVAVTLSLGLDAATIPPQSGSWTTDLQASAFTVEGDHRSTTEHVLTIPAGAGQSETYEAFLVLPLKPGRYELRFGAHVRGTDRSGAVYTTVDVPDFRRDRLTLSGAVIEVANAGRSGPADAFEPLGFRTSSTRRRFSPQDTAALLVRCYQGGRGALRPTTATVTVIDSADRVVARVERSLFQERTGPRSADIQFDLPLRTLPPGEYLLAVEAVAGRDRAERRLRFGVK
jgi:hypothetical protein